MHTANEIPEQEGFKQAKPMNAKLSPILSNSRVVLVRTLRSILGPKEQPVPFLPANLQLPLGTTTEVSISLSYIQREQI